MCNQNLQYFRKPLRLFLKKEISLAVGMWGYPNSSGNHLTQVIVRKHFFNNFVVKLRLPLVFSNLNENETVAALINIKPMFFVRWN